MRQPRCPSDTATTVALRVGRGEGVRGERDERRLPARRTARARRASRSRRTSATRPPRRASCSAREPLALLGPRVVGVLVAVPAPVPELGARAERDHRPRERQLQRVEDRRSRAARRGCGAGSSPAAAPAVPRARRRAASGSRAIAPYGTRGGSTATTCCARSRSSACSRRMKRSSSRGSSRTPIGARSSVDAGATGAHPTAGAPPAIQPRAGRSCGRTRLPRRRYRAPRMEAQLKRLATSGLAYQAAGLLAAFLALFTLPLYTRHLSEADFGYAETLLTLVILTSILLRFGMGEAFVRFWFDDEHPGRRRRLRPDDDGLRAHHDDGRAGRGRAARRPAVAAHPRHARRDAHGLRRLRDLGVHEPRDGLRAAAGRGAPAHVHARRGRERPADRRAHRPARRRARRGRARLRARQLRRVGGRARRAVGARRARARGLPGRPRAAGAAAALRRADRPGRLRRLPAERHRPGVPAAASSPRRRPGSTRWRSSSRRP